MKKIFSYIFLLVSFFSCEKESKKFLVETISIDADYRLNDIYFIDKNIGFATGGDKYDEGYILMTEDGGVSWLRVPDSSIFSNSDISLQTLYSIDFFNDSIGQVVGHGGKILRTENGGKNWDLIRHGSWENFHDLKMFSAEKTLLISGGAYGGGQYFWSEDKWFYFNVEEEIYALRDLEFLDNNIGYSAGFGFVKKTIDGGLTWNILDLKDDYFFDIHFPSSDVGYICGWQGGIYKTTDAGKNWKNVHPINVAFSKRYHFENIHFINNDIGLVCSTNGELLYTKNGGEKWFEIETNTNSSFHSLYFLNETTAFVGGNNGTLLRINL